MKTANLIKIEPEQNTNRVYIMSELGNGMFEVEYGRMGAALLKKKYPMEFWDQQYAKQISAGYTDRTKEYGIGNIVDGSYKALESGPVADFVNYLLSCSRKKIEMSYSVKHEEVSAGMIEKAQRLIHEISLASSIEDMKALYIDLYKAVPRKMKDVMASLPNTIADGQRMLFEEQSLLETLKAEKKIVYDERKTILESNGLEIRPVTEKEAETIREHMGVESSHLYARAFRVVNRRTEALYREYCLKHGIKRDHFDFHGSGNANYWGIMTEGLSLNPNAPITGKMFGFGIYFAPDKKAKKSIGYTDLNGSFWRKGHSDKAFLAVFKLAYKNAYHTDTCAGVTGRHSAPNGCDAVYAHAGSQLRNDEVIVYREDQCTIQYIIELKGGVR